MRGNPHPASRWSEPNHYDGDPNPFEMGWKLGHPYSLNYLNAIHYEVARCDGCRLVRLKAVGSTCEACRETCGRLFA